MLPLPLPAAIRSLDFDLPPFRSMMMEDGPAILPLPPPATLEPISRPSSTSTSASFQLPGIQSLAAGGSATNSPQLRYVEECDGLASPEVGLGSYQVSTARSASSALGFAIGVRVCRAATFHAVVSRLQTLPYPYQIQCEKHSVDPAPRWQLWGLNICPGSPIVLLPDTPRWARIVVLRSELILAVHPSRATNIPPPMYPGSSPAATSGGGGSNLVSYFSIFFVLQTRGPSTAARPLEIDFCEPRAWCRASGVAMLPCCPLLAAWRLVDLPDASALAAPAPGLPRKLRGHVPSHTRLIATWISGR